MIDENNKDFKLTASQDKLFEILLHAATREDIAKLDEATQQEFSKLDSRIDRLEANIKDEFNKVDFRIDKLETRIDKLDTTLREEVNRLDGKIDARFDMLSSKIDKVIYVVVLGLLIPIAMQFFSHFIHFS